jgi:hypothetical protein
MTLFAWLCIAHFVGDWVLQNDWMAREKGRHPTGAACLLHCLIYTAAVSSFYIAATASAGPSFWRPLLFAAIIFTSHWLIDGLHLAERWGMLFVQSPGPPVRTVVDQTMHIAVLALAISV